MRCFRPIVLLLGCAASFATGCSFDWDQLDPRATEGSGGAGTAVASGGSGTGGDGGGSATGTTSGTGTGTTTGAGGAEPCGGTCATDEECVDGVCLGEIELVANGTFDAGLDDWTDDNNPVNGNDTTITFSVIGGVCENGGSEGPSARVVYQDLAIPSTVADATFTLSFAQDNMAPLDPDNVMVVEKDPFDDSMNGLEENAFRIDLVDAQGDVFYATIELELFAPTMAMGSPTQLVMIADDVPGLAATLQDHAGGVLRLRIAQVESTFPWLLFVDDVSLRVTGAR